MASNLPELVRSRGERTMIHDGPLGPESKIGSHDEGESESESESYSDRGRGSDSDSSSSRSIPNHPLAQSSASLVNDGGPAARRVFKMKRTGRAGLLQPSSSSRSTSAPTHHRASLAKSLSSPTGYATARNGVGEPEPEPAMVTSDIVQLEAAPALAHVSQNIVKAGNRSSSKPTNRKPQADTDSADEEEKKRRKKELLSIQMKRRWASGSMNHVSKKRLETMRKRKATLLLAGEEDRTPKRRAPRAQGADDVGRSSASSKPGGTIKPSTTTPSVRSHHEDYLEPEEPLSPVSPLSPLSPSFEGCPEIWDYIRPHLVTYTKPEIPKWVMHSGLLKLPRLRNIDWNTEWISTNPFRDFRTKDILALIIQVTGDEAPKPCSRCEKRTGPFKRCVMVSLKAPKDTLARLFSCANCLYHFGWRMCEHQTWGQERARDCVNTGLPNQEQENRDEDANSGDRTSSSPAVTSTSVLNDGSSNQRQPRFSRSLERDSSSQVVSTPSTKEVPDPVDEEEQEAASHRQSSERLMLHFRRSANGSMMATISRTTVDEAIPSLAEPPVTPRPSEPPVKLASLISAGDTQSIAKEPEMEEWEIAPGRIRAEASDSPDNIALSKAYLTANHSVQICAGLRFRVDVIRSGETHRLDADTETTLVCSVATGKLRVQIAGEPDFMIGPHGLFKVRPGTSCSVQNRLYVDAMLHVSLLAGVD